MKRSIVFLAVSLGLAAPAMAQKKYDPGVSDKEIRIGNTNPYSGPASAYGTIGKSIAAYFKMVNDQGGINGRKVTFISYDDSYSPPKTVEMARKLVEQDEVLFVFQTLGTGTWAGWSISIWIMLIAFIVGGLVLARSVYGQSIYAIGGNNEAARL